MHMRRRFAFSLVLLLVVVGVVEGLSYALLWAAGRFTGTPIQTRAALLAGRARAVERFAADHPDSLTRFDAELGWTTRPGLRTEIDAIDAAGLRSEREYAPTPPPGVVRVAAFGDSFVYGSEVSTPEAWASLIERDHPDLEVLNHGVPGYGHDQAYLRFQREAARFGPQIALLGFTCHTIGRNANAVTREFDPAAFAPKPIYRVADDGALVLVPNPVERPADARAWIEDPLGSFSLARGDYDYDPLVIENPLYDLSAAVRLAVHTSMRIYRRYLDAQRPFRGGSHRAVCNERSPSWRIATEVLRRFDAESRAAGIRPVALILPDLDGLRVRAEGGEATCDPVLAFCREHGIDCLDAAEALLAGGAPDPAHFAKGGHYSAAGNAAVAAWLAPKLRERAPAR
jgi:hypothetical protein